MLHNVKRFLVGVIAAGVVVSAVAIIVAVHAADTRREREEQQAAQELASSTFRLVSVEDSMLTIRNATDQNIRRAELTFSCHSQDFETSVAFLPAHSEQEVSFPL